METTVRVSLRITRASQMSGAVTGAYAARRSLVALRTTRLQQAKQIAVLPEVVRLKEFRSELEAGTCAPYDRSSTVSFRKAGLSRPDVHLLLDAGLLTFILHVESRIAALLSKGFYTIGPCGEELLGAVGLALRTDDPAALHYRHLSTALVRAMRAGKPIEDILLDRARAYCVSTKDPVGRGHHCLVGGVENDFVVTSTLASQATPAVGRAAGLRLASHLNVDGARLPSDGVSYVSVGEGSVNNAHWLSATNFAEYMQHRGFQCPVVFGISNNNYSISLKNYGWLDKLLKQRLGMPVFEADANDLVDTYRASKAAVDYARSRQAPACVVFQNVVRRFGHAGTDRQFDYMSKAEIQAMEEHNALSGVCAQAVKERIVTYPQILARFNELTEMTAAAFDAASLEPKVSSRAEMVSFSSAPLVPLEGVKAAAREAVNLGEDRGNPRVMRVLMNRVFDEILETRPEVVYIGEDVQHGGYYRVTEGLHKKYAFRVADFPPEETALMGAAIGYSQAGLVPIIEIPYAKYLDCGMDMFQEAVVMNWLSGGKQPNGMVIRLQGFDKGVFGGNFHTHNSLYLPPGLDVVVYSNGADYVRGMRYAIAQAAAGRVVMSVDCTDLLNRRHIFARDDAWMTKYPPAVNDVMDFDEVTTYGDGFGMLIVTYGNGVPTALIAKKKLEKDHGLIDIVVVDVPYISGVPSGLVDLLPKYNAVVFADICKLGQHPQAGLIVKLQQMKLLPQRWASTAATPAYNPLGSTITFLSSADIIKAAMAVRLDDFSSTDDGLLSRFSKLFD